MKLHHAGADGANIITSSANGQIRVNAQTYSTSVVVLPDTVINPWAPGHPDGLAAEHFDCIVEVAPELVLLGTGERITFPHPSITRALIERGIGVEVMDTHAACRTYNVIVAEGRRVAAALLNGT